MAKRFYNVSSSFAEPYGHFYDCVSTIDDKEMQIELKTRDHSKVKNYALKYGFYIEPHKAENLIQLPRPLYVNFDGDWRSVYIWNMKKIDLSTIPLKKNVKITLKNGDYYYADRYCLPVSLATHYE